MGVRLQKYVGGGVKCRGKGRKTCEEYVRKDMELFGLETEWAIFRDVEGLNINMGQMSNPNLVWKKWTISK